MALTVAEAFRVGFALRCADEGLTGAEMRGRIEKAASFLEKRAVDPWSMGKDIVSGAGHLGGLATAAGIAAPIAVGSLGGYLAHKATEDDLDEEDVKKREMIDELRHWARRAREHRKARTTLPALP